MITIETHATERSTYAVTIGFRDDTNTAVVPTSATWSLLDRNNVVINSRNNVVITPLASSVTIVLSGADLAITDTSGVTRSFVVEFVYTSSLGAGLTARDWAAFTVDSVPGVS